METLLGYIKNIGFFLILVSVICNALPDNSYKKYCRLFCGLVLVVLVVAPFSEFLNYDGNISDIFINKSYESQLIELEANLKANEEKQMESILSRYEEQLKADLADTALEEGLYIHDVSVKYEYENNDELLLSYINVTMAEYQCEQTNYNEYSDINLDEIHIDDIEIDIQKGEDKENSRNQISDIDDLSPEDKPKVIKFIENMALMLGIETEKISITMKES